MRSAWFVVGLALRRLRRRDSGALVTALGLAVATAVLAGVLAGTTIATDRSTAQAIETIPISSRSVRAAWFGIPGDPRERLNVLDDAVDEASQGLGLDGPIRLVLFRESTVAGHLRRDHRGRRSGAARRPPLRAHAAHVHGRALRSAAPSWARGDPRRPGLRLVQVGTAALRSRQLYGDFIRSTDAAVAGNPRSSELGQGAEYHRPLPGAARRRGGACRAGRLSRARAHVSHVLPGCGR